MAIRQRLKNVVSIKSVKTLDAFPKYEEACQEVSSVGGTMSVISYILIIWLVISETSYYLHSKIVYKFRPDIEFDGKLKLHIDVTVAMPCIAIGADIVDSTDQSLEHFGHLQEEDTWFELEPAQRVQFEHIQHVNAYLRTDYHHVHEFLWRSNEKPFKEIPRRKNPPNKPFDACRVHGEVELNKVAGNLHIIAGKTIQLPNSHVHLSVLLQDRDYNFTHRINHFSFGDSSPGIVHPLEGDERVTNQSLMLFQYFLEVVPTEIETFLDRQRTYQYSAKNQEREINHSAGSHGVPGIFFKYGMSALKVRVVQERDSLPQFLVKLCATVSGVHIVSGLIAAFIRLVTCRVTS